MTCKDRDKSIGYGQHKASVELPGVELCERHTQLIKKSILNP